MARHTYLAQWVWNGEGWEAPLRAQCTGVLDLRSNLQCGTAVTPLGYGLFTYPAQVSIPGSLYFGQDNVRLSLTKRSTLNSMLGITVLARDADLIVKELLVDHGDPTGQTRWKPIRVGGDRKLHIEMAGIVLADEAVNDAQRAFENTMAVRRADYQRVKATGISLIELQKWTGYDLRKFNVAIDRLLDPQDLLDGHRTPETSISDNFNRANEALDTGGVWTEVNPTNWTVTSNQVVVGTSASANLARHNTALSSDDHKASVDITGHTATNGAVGVAARCSTDASPNHDHYTTRVSVAASSNVEFLKVVNGVVTTLDTAKTVTNSLPDNIQIEVNNSAMISRWNGTVQHNFTDTSLTGNLRCGINLRRTGGDALDNFLAEDLPIYTAPPQRTFQPFLAQ